MKILIFSGGLGNQLFCYSFFKYLKKKYANERIYGYYPRKMLNEHYGLEINKWFDVDIPHSSFFSKFILGYYYILHKVLHKNCIDLDMRQCRDEKKRVIMAFKQNRKYYRADYNLSFSVNEEELSDENKKYLNLIRETNSVFIHVRKGDYLSEKYKAKYYGTCSGEYYEEAVNYIKNNVENPHFFCFTDTIDWVKKNLKLDADFVSCNDGENSPLDMFLMSNCKYAIIANSTFSYWGALLGQRKEIIIYPLKWENSIQGRPDIIPENWIGF